jgi:sulfur carrier protein
MEITLNGKKQPIADRSTAAQLVASLGLAGQRVAMEVNEEILPRSEYTSYELKPNDKVEIVRAIGGG